MKSKIIPVSDRVLLENFLEDFSDMIGGVVIPDSARESLKKPKYRWAKIIGVGKGCIQVEVGQEAFVHEAQVEQAVIPKEDAICYIREAQIIAVRDAEPAPPSKSVD